MCAGLSGIGVGNVGEPPRVTLLVVILKRSFGGRGYVVFWLRVRAARMAQLWGESVSVNGCTGWLYCDGIGTATGCSGPFGSGAAAGGGR